MLLASLSASYRARADTDDDQQLRDEVIECEDAYARLRACCPGFSAPKVQCNYEVVSGCVTSSSTMPGIARYEASCIRSQSCAELVDGKVCARAAALSDERTSSDAFDAGSRSSSGLSGASGATRRPVCP